MRDMLIREVLDMINSNHVVMLEVQIMEVTVEIGVQEEEAAVAIEVEIVMITVTLRILKSMKAIIEVLRIPRQVVKTIRMQVKRRASHHAVNPHEEDAVA